MKTFYITTPIFYPSANMHIGNAYPTVIADIIARHHRLLKEDVFFLTGTDEHGQKIEKIAASKNMSPLNFVDQIVDSTQQLWRKLNISNDDFLRTSQQRHIQFVQKTFSYLLKKGDIYLGKYSGHYCVPCESFWTKTQLKDNKCPDCLREVVYTEEEAYFFKVSKYVDSLLKFYQGSTIDPEWVKKEMLNNFINTGLNDLCISRTSFSWGIPVLENRQHVIYVWFDALFNYLSALENDNYNKYWEHGDNIVLLHGKEIARFHLIYWPIFLMALDMRLPTKLLTHSWIVLGDQKISKSRTNAIDPNILIDHYGADVLRFFLATLDIRCDSNFSLRLLLQTTNDYLVNDLGNMLRRTTSMVKKYFNSVVPAYNDSNSLVNEFIQERDKVIKDSLAQFQAVCINEAIATVFAYIRKANVLIETNKPWELVKTDEKQLQALMFTLVDCLFVSATLLNPIIPTLSQIIYQQIGLKDCQFDLTFDNKKLVNAIVEVGQILVNRLDIEEEEKKFYV